MLDKIDVSCEGNLKHIKFIKSYCFHKNIKVIYGSGAKYFHQKSIITEYFQIYYSVNLDNSVTSFFSIGSLYSNKYGFYLLRKLNTLGIDKMRVRRLDFAFDLHGIEAKEFKIKKFNLKHKPNNSSPRQKLYFNCVNPDVIDTSYLMTSRFIIRMYDKGVEQGISPLNSDWKRFEVQIKSKLIDKFFGEQYLQFYSGSVQSILNSYKALLNEIISKYQFNEKYMKLLGYLASGYENRIKPLKRDNDLIKTMKWFKKHYHKHIRFYVANHIEEFQKLISEPKEQAKAIEQFMDYWSRRG